MDSLNTKWLAGNFGKGMVEKLKGNGKELPVSDMVRKYIEIHQTGRRWPCFQPKNLCQAEMVTSFPLSIKCSKNQPQYSLKLLKGKNLITPPLH